MGWRVLLEVTEGKLSGKQFEYAEHDTFLFGRSSRDCHAHLQHDPYVSRHHFLLEVNPPDARLRDLGSRNGTWVNGVKYGSRLKSESAKEGARRGYPEVDLQSGDLITVGETKIRFSVATDEVEHDQPDAREDDSEEEIDLGEPVSTLYQKTVQKPAATPQGTVIKRIVACQQCGKNVADEVGSLRSGDYICEACRDSLADDPAKHLQTITQTLQKRTGKQPGRKQPAGMEIPGYTVGRKLGDGGMGVVYHGTHLDGDSEVAIKLMLSRVAVDPRSRDMFLRECDVLKKLNHTNVVRYFDSGASGGAFYCVMEYCNAGSLVDFARRKGGRLSWKQVGPIAQHVLSGLTYAHDQGFVHRDLKPHNVLLHRLEGKLIAKVTDFGLAKNFQRAGFSGMTATGSFGGTYAYMPREQLINFKYVDPVSDIWSIGATFYHLLTGDYPRNFSDGRDPMDAILSGEIIPVRDRDPRIPESVAAVVDRAVADETADRYQTAAEMRKAFVAAFKSEQPRRKQR